jgi:sugar phosphate isomerase/epimerase
VWSIRHVHICDLMGHRKRERRRKRRRICHVRICDLMGHDRGGV